MNVRELIEKLQQIDPTGELPVVVDGYEDGYDDVGVREIRLIRIGELSRHYPDTGWYEEESQNEPGWVKDLFTAVYLPR